MLPVVTITTNTLHFGGAERQRVLLANALRSAGYDVQICALQALGPLADDVDEAVPVIRGRMLPPPPVGRPSVIISGTTNTEVMASIIAKLRSPRKTSWIAAAHNPPALRHTYGLFVRTLLPSADVLVVLSEGHGKALQGQSRLNRRVEIIPNGLPKGADSVARRPTEVLQLAFVGRLTKQKGLDLLIEALAKFQHKRDQWTLHVYGDGDERQRLEAQAQTLGLEQQIKFHGATDAPRARMSEADVVVVPSRNEAFPLVVLEAMAVGRAVVATPVGAIPDMLNGSECGWILPPQSDEWANALDRIGRMPTEVVSRGANARRRFLQFYTDDRMVDAYAAVINRCVSS